MDNVNSLLDGIKEFVENDEVNDDTDIVTDKSLSSYLQNIALHTDQDNEEDENNHVSLMSVHAAKGLEFKSVYIVGLEEKLFPSFMAEKDGNGYDEERRLFYVAITRAEQYLTLSYCNSRYRFGKMQNNEPSRFLNEISPLHLDNAIISRRGGSTSEGPRKSGVKGNFKKHTRSNVLLADPATFKPSPANTIQTGMKVLHLKFGEGKVLSIDGSETNRVATIHFNQIDDPQRRNMLKFAKLQILN